MDGSERRVLVNSKIYWPNTIGLDLTTNRLYFADSKLDYIDFVHYDGTGLFDCIQIYDGILGAFCFLNFFFLQNNLLLKDDGWYNRRRRRRKLNYLQESSGRTQVLSSTKFVQHPHALAIFEDIIYYSDRRLQRLQLYPKYPNGTLTEYQSHTFSKALGVTAVHPILQPNSENPCAGNPCSDLCLIGKDIVSFFFFFSIEFYRSSLEK